mmetsp:Transcript_18644/g.49422  ORF Transcript_18644/g.49422 Transcript_18644/m.49422 type:complete len:271 (-) Transcript_18644:944-1756(-)
MKTRGVVLLAYALRTAAADDRATHELTVAGERRLALPIVNSSGAMNLMGQGRMQYTYLSPRPFNFREHDNPWILLCGDIEIYDLSSSDLTAAFLHFDPATWKDDALRYPGTVPEVHGSYDERSRTMTLEATGGELRRHNREAKITHFRDALRTVLYKASEALSVRDVGVRCCICLRFVAQRRRRHASRGRGVGDGVGAAPSLCRRARVREATPSTRLTLRSSQVPNVHQRLVWISLEDAEGNRGAAFAINITLSTASTVLTDRTTTRHGR